ncbi:sorbitol ABC transporter ATP-binding protein /mannitol ABC transporter ATP-binding protein [Plasticicumulans lactativorans]|uniref:Sorbitol ABC transporter ATP-binding protein /mannitol ABC transporter ATP-binding protein n=1 Tax=Plasticicumulans lactativorans TaxID=1133106 RepID=A0A4R2L6C2_9GAMM|nr:sn-glycerol-3-phosphate ABC transporter ATP-binding protein UgpC [Plasticicumulans lactativorans]TCO79619.1 sorbitol ABC transporter ATP-binding protein /mannitol ABC transporter ATP-binding protein [Plasticicumulans lactativorans]
MSDVVLRQVRKAYGSIETIHGIDLAVESGEFVVFVGPSGCGKSTLLRMIAGLEDITSGELEIAGVRADTLPPARRQVAMVFQSYALYPHLTVFENMAFGLTLAGESRDVIRDRVSRAAQVLQLSHLLERKPKALSGGQRQRVAIGRAIVRKPAVFLFDEPLSNLDASLRVQMRIEIARLHAEMQATMIYVTHDQVEAMTLADKIVVLNKGGIEQVGSPLDLYHHPRNLFVAGFIGSPKMNFLEGVLQGTSGELATVTLADGTPLQLAIDTGSTAPGTRVTVGVRPEHFVAVASGGLAGRVLVVEHLGDATFAYVDVPGRAQEELLIVRLPANSRTRIGDTLHLDVPVYGGHLFDTDGHALRRLVTEDTDRAAA